MNVDIASKKEQRKFGFVMAVAIAILGLVRWWLHGCGELPVYFFYVAAAFAALGLVAPRVLKPVFYLWIKFGLGMNWVMTRVILLIAFWLMIVPARILIRLFGTDPLKREFLPATPSYWEDAEEQPESIDRYFNQF
jgi:hypothetical protein